MANGLANSRDGCLSIVSKFWQHSARMVDRGNAPQGRLDDARAMKERYRLFLRRKNVYYAFDNTTRTFESLKTKDKAEARRMLVALNEAGKQSLSSSSMRTARPGTRPLAAEITAAFSAFWASLLRSWGGRVRHKCKCERSGEGADPLFRLMTQQRHGLGTACRSSPERGVAVCPN